MDYERLRREKLEAQLDEYRREIAHLDTKIDELAVNDEVGEGNHTQIDVDYLDFHLF